MRMDSQEQKHVEWSLINYKDFSVSKIRVPVDKPVSTSSAVLVSALIYLGGLSFCGLVITAVVRLTADPLQRAIARKLERDWGVQNPGHEDAQRNAEQQRRVPSMPIPASPAPAILFLNNMIIKRTKQHRAWTVLIPEIAA